MPRITYSATRWVGALVLSFVAFTSQPLHSQASPAEAKSLDERLPLLFEQNVGQTDSQVRFLARAGRYQLYLTDQTAVMKIAGAKQNVALRTTLLNANKSARILGWEQEAAKTNYLVGPASGWKTGVPNFAAVKYEGVYPGIDLKYYDGERHLEYDFMVAPNADPSMISLEIEGADKITTSQDGSLVLLTDVGEVRWRRPIAYQQSGTRRTLVRADYRLQGDRIRFQLGPYDHRKSLIIDPTLVYGTFLDGSNFDHASGFFVDSAGFNYVFGTTSSSDFPVTPGAYMNFHTTNNDGFISKLSQDGSHLIWSTMIAGTGPDTGTYPSGFTVDDHGNVYVVGQTGDFTYDSNGNQVPQVSTFPTSPGAYNSTELAGWREFLVKLNNTGTALDFSTFLSTEPNIYPGAVAVDANGDPYVTGYYNQSGGLTAPFPATAGAYQSTYAGDNDAFVMKFNSTATALDYATLIGGKYDDTASQILVDTSGNATIDGPTYSPNYPITPNGLRQSGDAGGFITTLNSTGTALLYSTVLNNVEIINVKRDVAGYYYVGGSAGTNLPTTANAFQKTFPSVESQTHLGFLTEIDPAGKLVYSSYLGGNVFSPSLEDTQIQLVSPDKVVIAGNRYADSTFPVTDRSYEQDNCSYIAKFNTQASGAASLTYSGCTPINGTNNVTVNLFRGIGSFFPSQLYIDNHNDLYGLNSEGPTSSNAFQKSPPNPNGGNGNFVWLGKYDLTKPGPGGVNLSTPQSTFSYPYGNPVVFRATGENQQCSAGVSAMRVYSAPGVVAYTTSGATLDANIYFPVSGSSVQQFNPVIVVYDKCGKAFSLAVPIIVQGPTSPPDPSVISPTDETNNLGSPGGPLGSVTSPVHFVASASAVNCTSGIAAMRIYTAPGVTAYTVNAASLDTYLKMAKGTYHVVVQAWDKCGNVYETPLLVTVE